jgi:hypothetical protein
VWPNSLAVSAVPRHASCSSNLINLLSFYWILPMPISV